MSSTVTDLGNGNTIEKFPDGTKIQRSANGTTLKISPNGTKEQTTKDGVCLIVRPDGTKEQTNSRGVKVVTFTDGRTIQANPDGVVIEISTDKKTKLQKNPDGSEVLVRPDGSKQMKGKDGSLKEFGTDGKQIISMAAIPMIPVLAEEKAPPPPPVSRAPPTGALPVAAVVAASAVSVSAAISARESDKSAKDRELAAVAAIQQEKKTADRVLKLERELDAANKRIFEMQAKLDKSQDDEVVSKAAEDHARLLVKMESDLKTSVEEKKQLEMTLTATKASLVSFEAIKAAALAEERARIYDLESKLYAESQTLSTTKSELDMTSAQLIEQRSSREQAEAKLIEAAAAHAAVEAAKAVLEAEHAQKKADIDALNGRLADSTGKGASAATKLAELKFQKATAEERARMAAEECAAAKAETEAFKVQIAEVTAVNAKLTAEIMPRLQSQADSAQNLETDVEILLSAKEAAESELQLSRSEAERLQNDLTESLNEVTLLKTEFVGKDFVSELAHMKGRAEDAEQVAIKAGEKIDQLEKELQSVKIESQELRLRYALGDSGNGSGQQSGSESSQQNGLAESEMIKNLKNELASAQNKLADESTRARKAEVERDSVKRQYELQISSLERERDALMDSMRKLPEKSKSMFSLSKGTSKRGGLAETDVDLNHQLAEKQRDFEVLQEQMDALYKDKQLEIDGLSTKVQLLESSLNEKTKELESVNSTGFSPSDKARLEHEIAALKSKLEVAITGRTVTEDKLRETEERLKRLEESGGGAGNSAVLMAAATLPRTGSIQSGLTRSNSYEDFRKLKENEVASHNASINSLHGQISTLQTELAQTKEQLDEKQRALHELEYNKNGIIVLLTTEIAVLKSSQQMAQAPAPAPIPAYIAPAPTYSAPVPAYSAPAPTHSAAHAPTFAAPAPTYATSTYSAPTPTYLVPAATYSAPALMHAAPAPTYATSTYSAPYSAAAPNYAAPTPSYSSYSAAPPKTTSPSATSQVPNIPAPIASSSLGGTDFLSHLKPKSNVPAPTTSTSSALKPSSYSYSGAAPSYLPKPAVATTTYGATSGANASAVSNKIAALRQNFDKKS